VTVEHGRLLGASEADHMSVFKFTKPANGNVTVTAVVEMNFEWLKAELGLVLDEQRKVHATIKGD